ncbi:Leukosialin [Manis javanica]|nr:Leukosialin [Manis javanica]
MLEWGGWSHSFALGALSAQSCPSCRRSWSDLAPVLCPYQVSWSQLLLLLVAMQMTLLFLLFAGILVQEMTVKSLVLTTILQTTVSSSSSVSLVSDTTKTPNLKSAISALIKTRVTEKNNSTGHQIFPSTSTPYTANDVSSPGTSIAVSSGQSVPDPANSQEISTKQSSVLQLFKATSNPAISVMNSQHMTSGIMATSSLETSKGTNGPSVPMATSSLESSMETSGPSVLMATSSLKTSMGTSGPSVPMATSSLETSKGINHGTNGTLLVALLVALLMFIVLMALLLLWHQRQKRRTGILTLSIGGKRNGVVDAWAGPAQVCYDRTWTRGLTMAQATPLFPMCGLRQPEASATSPPKGRDGVEAAKDLTLQLNKEGWD